MAFFGLIGRGRRLQTRKAQAWCDTITRVARQPGFYGAQAVPDSLMGRLELMTLHAALLLIRLRAEPDQALVTQLFVDRLFKSFDEGLREAGVGDLTVPKSMRRIAGRFYGQLKAIEAALALGEVDALAKVLQTQLGADLPYTFAQPLAQYALTAIEQLSARPIEQVHELACWPPPPLQRI